MSYQVVPYAAWSPERMEVHLLELIKYNLEEGIHLEEDEFFAAVFLLKNKLEDLLYGIPEHGLFRFHGKYFYNG